MHCSTNIIVRDPEDIFLLKYVICRYLDNYFKIHVCLSFCPFIFCLFVTLQHFIMEKFSEALLGQFCARQSQAVYLFQNHVHQVVLGKAKMSNVYAMLQVGHTICSVQCYSEDLTRNRMGMSLCYYFQYLQGDNFKIGQTLSFGQK